jgi:hypothetical protein
MLTSTRTPRPWTNMLASTRTPLPQRRSNTKPNEKLPKLQPMSSAFPQTGIVNNDSIPIQPERRTVHDSESIGHLKSDEHYYVQSTMSQSDSSSMRNESIPSSTRTRKCGRVTHRSTKRFITLRNTTDSSMRSSSEVTEAGFGNECNFVDKVGLDRVSLVEQAFDIANNMETSDGGKLWRLSAMQTPFVCVSSLWCPFLVCWSALVDRGLLSNLKIASDRANVHVCTVQSTQTQGRRLR